jgi:hypothetical protein
MKVQTLSGDGIDFPQEQIENTQFQEKVKTRHQCSQKIHII